MSVSVHVSMYEEYPYTVTCEYRFTPVYTVDFEVGQATHQCDECCVSPGYHDGGLTCIKVGSLEPVIWTHELCHCMMQHLGMNGAKWVMDELIDKSLFDDEYNFEQYCNCGWFKYKYGGLEFDSDEEDESILCDTEMKDRFVNKFDNLTLNKKSARSAYDHYKAKYESFD